MNDPYVHRHDRPALGCIGRCKVCGKAIELRRLVVHPPGVRRHELDRWEHFTEADHAAVLNPGVCDEPLPEVP